MRVERGEEERVGAGLLELERLCAELAVGNLVGHGGGQGRVRAERLHGPVDAVHDPLAPVVVLVKDGELLDAQLGDGVGDEVVRLVGVVRVVDEHGLELVLRLPRPELRVGVGVDQRQARLGDLVLDGVDHGRAHEAHREEHRVPHLLDVGHGAAGVEAVVLDRDLELAPMDTAQVVDIARPGLLGHGQVAVDGAGPGHGRGETDHDLRVRHAGRLGLSGRRPCPERGGRQRDDGEAEECRHQKRGLKICQDVTSTKELSAALFARSSLTALRPWCWFGPKVTGAVRPMVVKPLMPSIAST